MSKSDWITMVFPIIANGILLYLFHKGIEKKFEQDGKRNKLRDDEYYGAAEPPVRCGESHLSGLTEPPHFVY